ncbi:hypothetical protein HU200_051406 [Digitaria exilis]|uniref:Uncharacterized protein n=1 Tax=Digitaria exilis TaxID=1010633 RepID=A0A835AUN1_9POAL|nr:hypothetical protein HU200_051406 [Digitaria exilis]
MAPQPRVPWWIGVALAEQTLKLVAQLRYYLGGENYTSGKYRPAHTMLFVAEQRLRALDLDGEGLLVIDELDRARERLAEEVESMKAAAKEAGAGGRNGGAAADAQRAAARWLDEDGDRLLRIVDRLQEIANADSDLEQLERDDLAVVPPESVENAKRYAYADCSDATARATEGKASSTMPIGYEPFLETLALTVACGGSGRNDVW